MKFIQGVFLFLVEGVFSALKNISFLHFIFVLLC